MASNEKPLPRIPKSEEYIPELEDDALELDHDDRLENTKELPLLPNQTDPSFQPTPSRKSYIRSILIIIIAILHSLFFVLLWIKNAQSNRALRNPPPIPSRDGSLNFITEYPPLNPSVATVECQAAWRNLTSVPCHSAIWTRNWDSGEFTIMGPSLDQYVPQMCTSACADALKAAKDSVTTACSAEEQTGVSFWITGNYRGRFNLTLLEPSPSTALAALHARHTYMCRKSPINDDERGFCVLDLSHRWNIVDGVNADGMGGLDWFLSTTKTSRTEAAKYHSGRQGMGGWSESYHYWREERRFGPGRNSTTCSWCTFDWFSSKILLWKEGMLDHEGNELSLPHFLSRWEGAGRRCEGERFEEIYQHALQFYQNNGLLEEDWDRKPNPLEYVLAHGPSSYADHPIPQIDAAIDKLAIHLNRTALVNPSSKARQNRMALVTEYMTCLSAFKEALLDLDCYPFLSWSQISQDILPSAPLTKNFCAGTCDLRNLHKILYDSCPLTQRRSLDAYDRKGQGVLNLKAISNFTFMEYFGREGTIVERALTCKAEGRDRLPCTAIMYKSNVSSWLHNKPPLRTLLQTINRQLSILPPMPEELADFTIPTDRHLTKSEHEISRQRREWINGVKDGVCSECIFREFVPSFRDSWTGFQRPVVKGEKEEVMGWIWMVHKIVRVCGGNGRKFIEREVKAVDERWVEVHGQPSFDEALKEDWQIPAWLSENRGDTKEETEAEMEDTTEDLREDPKGDSKAEADGGPGKETKVELL